MNIEEKLSNPIQKTGLSLETVCILKELGYTTLNSIISEEKIDREQLYERIMSVALPKYKDNKEKLSKVQHAYIELLELIQYYGIILDEKTKKPNKQKVIKITSKAPKNYQ